MRLKWWLGPLLCLGVACAGTEARPAALSEPSPTELMDAPQQVNIEGRTYHLHANLRRDFMPGVDASPEGKPLVCVVHVQPHSVARQPSPPPEGLAIDGLWVLKHEGAQTKIWRPGLLEEVNAHMPNPLEKMGRGGPHWEPGTHVDVVVRLVHPVYHAYLLRAADQVIKATH